MAKKFPVPLSAPFETDESFGYIYGDIVYPFSDRDDLRDKPKIFIVQVGGNTACVPEWRERDSLDKYRNVLIGHGTIPHETVNSSQVWLAFTFSKYNLRRVQI